MGHIYREIKGNNQVIAWRVVDVVNYVKQHGKVPDILKPYINRGVLEVIRHTNGAIDIAMCIRGETQSEWNPDDMLMILVDVDDSLSIMSGFQFHNQWTEVETWVDAKPLPASDNVNHPAHYGGEDDLYEVIKVIEAWGLDFHLGNAVKYIARAGKKDPVKELEDIKKARWYLNRKIQELEK